MNGHREAAAIAAALRRREVNVEVHHREDKPAAQVRHAARKGIPFAWFPPAVSGGGHEVLDLGTGERVRADPDTWSPRR
ncbi:hypothetical protein GCM10009634_80730 [Saccharothrix xinjiangensis]